jgi:hypothetical protein
VDSSLLVWGSVAVGVLIALGAANPDTGTKGGTSNLTPRQLHDKFAAAGTLQGRTKDDIIALVGPASSFSGIAEGKFVLQWMKTSAAGAYHITLRFGADGVCEGVTHEYNGLK